MHDLCRILLQEYRFVHKIFLGPGSDEHIQTKLSCEYSAQDILLSYHQYNSGQLPSQ